MWITVPASMRPAGTSHSSLMPMANCSGSRPAPSGKRRRSCLVRLPRTPSQKIVTLAWMSTPGSKLALGAPCLPTAAVAGAHADDARAVEQHLLAGEAGEEIDAGRLGLRSASQRPSWLSDTIDVAVIGERRRDDGSAQRAVLGQEVDAVA